MNEKARILVVDDNPDLLFATCRILKNAGYETIEAGNGQDGLRLTMEHNPDLVLLDVILPDIHGDEVCRRIKSDPKTAHIYVVLLSSTHIESDSQAERLEHGADGYIARPMPNRELLARIKAMLRLKCAETRLRESEEQFRLMFENHEAIMLLIEPESGSIVDANTAAAEYYGYSRETLCKMRIQDINCLQPGEVVAERQRVKLEQRNCLGLPHRLSTGDIRTVEVHSSPIDIQGRTLLFSIVHDITERSRVEQEKQALQAQLFQSQKMETLGTLVGGIAHDFNNMLQVMLGYSQFLLDDKKKGEPGYNELQTIIETAKGGDDLVKKLLAFGQQGQVFPVPLDLNHQISQMGALISHTLPQVVQIDLNLADGPTTIRGDHGQIDQLVMNLAINASEAMPNGGRLKIITKTVFLDNEHCRRQNGAKPGNYVMLSVLDNGSGMDKATLAKAFDPFFSTKQRGSTRGTGLGLSVVKGIVQQQGGHLTCESELGKGTEFQVYFPAIEATLTTVKTDAPEAQSVGNETILVVEDNMPVAELERRFLANAGYKVIMATNGQEALDIYQARKCEIALVILDLLMPEMSGRDCLMELLKIDPSVKVLIASGYAPEDELHKEISALVSGFLHKPFATTELLNEARSVLDRTRTPGFNVLDGHQLKDIRHS
jgi:PAS domain S-box-containing protein